MAGSINVSRDGWCTISHRGRDRRPWRCWLFPRPVWPQPPPCSSCLPSGPAPFSLPASLPFEGLLLQSLRCLQSDCSIASSYVRVLLWDREVQRATWELLLSSVRPHAFSALRTASHGTGRHSVTCLCCPGRSSPFPPVRIHLSEFLSSRSNHNNNDNNNYNTLAF